MLYFHAHPHWPHENEVFILPVLQVAKYNRKEQPSAAELEAELKKLRDNHSKEESLVHILRYPKLRLRAILLLFVL